MNGVHCPGAVRAVTARAGAAARGRPSPVGARGFTLLEILLALVLFAFVMAGVWGALAGATRITRASNALMAQNEQVRTVQQFVRRDLGAAGRQPFIEAADAPARMFRGSATSMQFVAPLPTQAGHAGLYLQKLAFVRDANDRYALELSYRPYAGFQPASAKPVRRVLLKDLHRGSFHYLAMPVFGKPAQWRDDWSATTGLPLAVRIRARPAWRAPAAFPEMLVRVHAGEGLGLQTGGAGP